MKTTQNSLSITPKDLQCVVLDLQKKIIDKDARIEQLEQKNKLLMEQFRLAQQHRFGKSSEAMVENVDQLGLFNEAEDIVEASDSDEAVELESLATSAKNQNVSPYPQIYQEKPSCMISMRPTRFVIAVATTYTRWVKIKAKSLSLFQHNSKSSNISV